MLACAIVDGAAAYTFKVLYSFCGQPSCADGSTPMAGLVRDGVGNFYGASQLGGQYAQGVVFELSPGKKSGSYTYQALYSFCAQTNCPDGRSPESGLIVDSGGDLYGTAYAGGAYGNGDVFELIPNANRTAWQLKVLYSFCAQTNCADGMQPVAALAYKGQLAGQLYDQMSPLYGTTPGGGTGQAGLVFSGTAFMLKSSGGVWSETVLHDFCSRYVNSFCRDGNYPQSPVIVDSHGNLFGTTYSGGIPPQIDQETYYGGGTVYELRDGGGKWSETVLYSFCTVNEGYCADGSGPIGGLAEDSGGDLVGGTFFGGNIRFNKESTIGYGGVMYKVVPNGSASIESVLYPMCANKACGDGASPSASPVLDATGNRFATAIYGGDEFVYTNGAGTVFRLNADNAISVLHRFCGVTGCPDGAFPSGLIGDGKGNYYGTAQSGGAANKGVVWAVMK